MASTLRATFSPQEPNRPDLGGVAAYPTLTKQSKLLHKSRQEKGPTSGGSLGGDTVGVAGIICP